MKYIIMADGQGHRWNGYLGIEKHDIRIDGETLLERTVRLVKTADGSAEVIITSHDESVCVAGAVRYEPQNNIYEVDRFTAELIGDEVCFLYGDVLYSENAIAEVIARRGEQPVLFFGSEESICAVLVRDGKLFAECVNSVRESYLRGETAECKGWQVYHCYAAMPLEGRAIGRAYVRIGDFTRDFNTPEDYEDFLGNKGAVP